MVGNPSSVSSPKLLDQVRGKIRLKHYSIRTEQTYTDWIKRYLIPRQATRHVTQTMTAAAYSGKTWPVPAGSAQSVFCEPPQRGDFRRACSVQRVCRIAGARVAWPHIHAIQHLQSGAGNHPEQFLARAQTQMFGQIGKDQPAFAAGCEVSRQPVEEAEQHATVRVVHRVLNG